MNGGFRVANHLVQPSYISLQMALGHYCMIPEGVFMYTSVTTEPSLKIVDERGSFSYFQIEPDFYFGYYNRQVTMTEYALVATPEKAILDLLYSWPDGDNPDYIQTLRLQNLELVDTNRLKEMVERANKPKLTRALPHLMEIIREDLEGWVTSEYDADGNWREVEWKPKPTSYYFPDLNPEDIF